MDPRHPTLREEGGFMLTELLVVMALLLVVLTAILSVVQHTTRISSEDQERAHAISTAQVEVEGLVREARQAFRVNPSTATRLDVSVYRAGQNKRVVFDCGVAHPTLAGTRRCVRREVLADGTLTAPTVAIDRIRNTSVFTYTPPTGVTAYVAVTAEVPASGERASGRNHLIRLHDGFAVRNRGVAP